MGPKSDSKTNSTPSPSYTANNQDNILEEIKQLIATISARIEKRIDSVKEQIKNHRDELINIEVKANKAISLGESNASKIQTNSSKIECNEFEIDQLKNKVASINEELNEFRAELDDMRNRGLRKTLIFKNIPFKKKEAWDESKEILVKEIKTVIPDLEESYHHEKNRKDTQIKRNGIHQHPSYYCKVQ